MQLAKMTLPEFWDLLNGFDWFWSWSDDYSVCRFQEKKEQAIEKLAAESGHEFVALLAAFRAHKFGGPTFGRPEAPKPVRPS